MRRFSLNVFTGLFIIAAFAGCQSSSNSNANPTPTPTPPATSTSPLTQGVTPTTGSPNANPTQNAIQPSGTLPAGIPDVNSQKNNNTTRLDEKTTPSKGSVAASERNKKRLQSQVP